MRRLFMLGDRVRVIDRHPWAAGRSGTIIKIEDRTGNRFTVKMDREEIGLFSDEKMGPTNLLRLGDIDLEWLGEEDDD